MKALFRSWFASAPATKVPATIHEPKAIRQGKGGVESQGLPSNQPSVSEKAAPLTARQSLQDLVLKLQKPTPELRNSFLTEFEASPISFDCPLEPIDDVWEERLNKLLHDVFGWCDDVGEEAIRGLDPQRVQGLLAFTRYFVDERGLSEALLEPRLERLVEGIKKW
jgi:hypothetical protein